MIIEWPENVNKHILDDMSLTAGGKGYVEDKTDSGKYKEKRLTRNYYPEEYTINMEFNWTEKDENGKSEFIRFMDWYENVHKRGVNPFAFPSIRRYTDEPGTETGTFLKENLRYRIKSQLAISKHGYAFRVAMTMVEDFSGHIYIPSTNSVWPETVNEKILEATNFSTSEGGVIDTEGPNGEFSERHLNEEVVPDTYSVTMDFNWLKLDANGKSEFDRFLDWYYFGHKRGLKAFEFSSIKNFRTKEAYRCYRDYGTEKQTIITEDEYIDGKLSVDEVEAARYTRSTIKDDDGNPVVPLDKYKITSSIKAVKSGYCMRVTMTFENIVTEEKELITESQAIDHIEIENGLLYIYYINDILAVPEDVKLYYGTDKDSLSEITLDYSNGMTNGKVVSIPFTELTSGNYYISLSSTYSSTSRTCSLLGVK